MSKKVGVGVDIVDIGRFKALRRTEKKAFLERIFTPAEQEYCFSKKNVEQHLAARFAAKEAAIKALTDSGLSKAKRIPLHKIEVRGGGKEAPKLKIHNSLTEDFNLRLSLSHEKKHAIAFVIAAKEGELHG